MQRLYTIERAASPKINRKRAVLAYETGHIGSKTFGLLVNEFKQAKINYSYAENMRYVFQTARREFREHMDGHEEPLVIKRIIRNRLFTEYVHVDANETHSSALKRAVSRLTSSISQHRTQCKRIDPDSSNQARITMRKPGYWLRKFEYRMFNEPKMPPKCQTDFTGIEIECVFPDSSDFSTLKPFAKYLNIGSDGSIDADARHSGREFRVCIHRDEVREVLPKLLAELKALGAYVNKSCGLHVHLDQRDEKDPALTYAKLVRSLGLLWRIIPESRRNNTYCKRNRNTNFSDALNGARYRAVNATAYHRHKTIEVRLFGGSLDAEKIVNWVEVLWGIVKGEVTLRCPRSFDAAAKYWKISAENLAWLKGREEQFRGLNATPVNESDDEETPEDVDSCECGDCQDCGYAEDESVEEEAA